LLNRLRVAGAGAMREVIIDMNQDIICPIYGAE
jgi:hypothetical protein